MYSYEWPAVADLMNNPVIKQQFGLTMPCWQLRLFTLTSHPSTDA